VNVAVDQGIEVCLAHGDLNCTNVLKIASDDEVWLLDWEQSDHSAPILTDPVCVAVDKLWLANAEDTSGNLQKFKDTFIYENDPEKRTQIILALAYLAAAGFPPALTMMDAMYAEGS
jgi:aminoglycoside phosphotransferase (APT) family kinase protein